MKRRLIILLSVSFALFLVAISITVDQFSSRVGPCEDVPSNIRDIKQEARFLGIKGTNKLNQYLLKKQITTSAKKHFTIK